MGLWLGCLELGMWWEMREVEMRMREMREVDMRMSMRRRRRMVRMRVSMRARRRRCARISTRSPRTHPVTPRPTFSRTPPRPIRSIPRHRRHTRRQRHPRHPRHSRPNRSFMTPPTFQTSPLTPLRNINHNLRSLILRREHEGRDDLLRMTSI